VRFFWLARRAPFARVCFPPGLPFLRASFVSRFVREAWCDALWCFLLVAALISRFFFGADLALFRPVGLEALFLRSGFCFERRAREVGFFVSFGVFLVRVFFTV
jgi:hypothetical protein